MAVAAIIVALAAGVVGLAAGPALAQAPGPAPAAGGHPVAKAEPAPAQGVLMRADPSPDAVLQTSPGAVTLTFSTEVAPELSHLAVLDGRGSSVATGDYTRPTARQLHLPVRIRADGDYTVAYHVTFPDGTSVTDLHRFSVGTGVVPAPLDAAARQVGTDAVTRHAHQIDGFSAALLIIDGLVLFGVLALLWLRPRDGRPMRLRPTEPD